MNAEMKLCRQFKTSQIVSSKSANGTCNGYLASGKPCTKTKTHKYNLCTRCFGKLKAKSTGKVKYDDMTESYYREVKFLQNDPNGLFQKGQIVKQYSKSGHLYDFNGIQTQKYYYIYTLKDAETGFKTCSIITTSNPFVKGTTLENINLSEHEIIENKRDLNIDDDEVEHEV